MLFGGDPDVAVGPEGEGTEFLDRWVSVGDGVADGQLGWIENTHVAPEAV